MKMRVGKLIAVTAVAAAVHGVSFAADGGVRTWRHGITADDAEFWASCKRAGSAGSSRRGGDLQGESSDAATNVRAVQVEGSKIIRITYDADYYKGGWPLAVSVEMKDGGTPVPCVSLSGDVGNVPSGKGKVIEWDAGADWNGNYTENMTVTVIAIPAEHPSSWASIQIVWSNFGGRDLDVCGYWEDVPSVKVGYSYGTGSLDRDFMSDWEGDNTGSGPEYINVGVKPGQTLVGVIRKVYRVHCNYYGSNGNPPKATIRVSCNGVSCSKTITASTRNGSPAQTSDPGVAITFNEMGELVSIE